ncbi:MAG: helix-turn-helix domain-containing protein [Planctomycetota bacterium]|jgi:excisionase family DNA binding protein
MGAVSTTRKEVVRGDEGKTRIAYMTTTELARLCGVSRFTIINWANKGKIKAHRTVGKHYRIPVSEAMVFLEAFRNKKKGVASGSSGHCWEYLQKTNCDRECSNCLIYRREVDYCFEVVRQFGKGVISCKGDCLNCGYFEHFFSFYRERTQREEPHDENGKKAANEKKNFFYNVAYGVGLGVKVLKRKE